MTKKTFTEEEVTKMFKQHNKVSVVFLKKNGTERTMLCTQKPKLIPSEKYPNGKGKDRAKPVGLGVVFDLEKGDWRSFHIDSVISMTPYWR